MIKFKDTNNSVRLAVASINRKHSVNGEKSLSGTIYDGKDVLNNIDTGWGLEFDDEPYVITYYEHHDSDNTISFDAIHKFFWDFSKKMFYRKFNGSNTIGTYLGNIFDGTDYTYSLNFSPNAITKDGFGMTSRMSMFNDIITSIGAEFEVNGTLVSIYQKIGTDLSTIVRHGFNLSDMSIQNDISGFATYAEGFGVRTNPNDDNSPRLHVVYESPLAKTYGRLETDPIDDERYTVEANLLAALQAKVDNTLPVSISLSLYDLNKSGYPYKMAKVGDWITAVDEKINFKQKIRIISIDDAFSADGTRISYAVTAGNVNSVQKYQEANASISSRINNAISSAEQANQSAISAQIAADGKNTIYRVNSVDSLPTNANEGDLGWVQSGDGLVLYIYTKKDDGSFYWEKRIDPEMGEQIDDGVNKAIEEAKSYTDNLDSTTNARIEQTTADINQSIAQAQTGIQTAQASANKALDDNSQIAKDLNAYKSANDVAMSKQQTVVNQVSADGKTVKSILSDGQGNWYQDLNTAVSKQTVMVNAQGDISRAQQTADGASLAVNNVHGDVVKVTQTANEAKTTASNAQGQVSTLSQTVDGLKSTVESKASISYVDQKADSIKSTVANKASISYVDQKADSISSIVSNLSYENRNYVLNSVNLGLNTQTTGYLSDDLFNSINVAQSIVISFYLTLTNVKSIATSGFKRIGLEFNLINSNKQSINFRLFANVNGVNNDQGYVPSIGSSFNGRLSATISTAGNFFGGISNKNTQFNLQSIGITADTISITDIQLETGSKLTPYTKAPDDVDNEVSNIKQTANGIVLTVANTTKDLTSQINQAKDQINLSVKKGDVINQINLDTSGIQLKSSLITLDSDTTVTGGFFAKGGYFTNLNASNMTTGTLDASKVNVANLDAGSITSGRLNTKLLTISSDSTDSLQMTLRNSGLHIEGHVPGAYFDNRLDINGLSLTFPGTNAGTWGQDTFQRAGGVQAISLDPNQSMFNTSVVLYGDKTGGGHSAALGIKNPDGVIHRSFVVTDGAGLPDYANQGAGLYAFDQLVLTAGLTLKGTAGASIQGALSVSGLISTSSDLYVNGGFKTGVFGKSQATLRFQSVTWGNTPKPAIINENGTGIVIGDHSVAIVRDWVVGNAITI